LSTPLDDVAAVMGMIADIYLTWERYRQRQILPFGASLKQYFVLRQLDKVDYLNPSQIATVLFCDRPTATVIIRNLENKGWVSRQRDPLNLKRHRISLTPAGREKVAEIARAGVSPPGFDPLAVLDAGEARTLRTLLARVYKHVWVLNERGRTGE